jgi:hypothetical protein
MKHQLRILGLASTVIAISFAAPSDACYQRYCSINCGGSEYRLYDFNYEQCCSNPYIPYECPNGDFRRVNYWFSGCAGYMIVYCPVE